MFTKTKLVVKKEEVSTLTPDGYSSGLLSTYKKFMQSEDDFNFNALLYVGSETNDKGELIETFKKINFILQKTKGKDGTIEIFHDFWYGDVSLNTSRYGYDRYLCETVDDIRHIETIEELSKDYAQSPYYMFEKMIDEGYKYINYDEDQALIDACGF